ncbi:MAG: 50S ribosomal protein L25 [Deltaproteobacteria bacterium]|nr:50S ribosomal protein L25 [Deltaproteobacteria bacterium]
MQQMQLKAEERPKTGKGETRRLRVKGFVPAVLYGKGIPPRTLMLQAKELDKILSTSAGMNALISLDIGNEKAAKKDTLVVMMKDYQADIISRCLTHVDLLKVDLKEKITVMVPVRLVGKSEGVVKGGLVEQAAREISVKCLPTAIPNQIEVDITKLDIGDSLHIDDLKFAEGVEPIRESNFTIVAIMAPAAEEAAPTPVEGAVPAEGAAAPAAGAPAAAGAKGEASKAEGAKAGAPKAEKPEKK